MFRSDNSIMKLFQAQSNSRPLVALVSILAFAREEELVANSLKIIKFSIKDEKVSSKIPIFITASLPQLLICFFLL